MSALGELIGRRRKELRLTQAQLASVVGIDRTDISRIESGSRSMTAATILSMAKALDIDVAGLTELVAQFERERASLDADGRVIVPPDLIASHGPDSPNSPVPETSSVSPFTPVEHTLSGLSHDASDDAA